MIWKETNYSTVKTEIENYFTKEGAFKAMLDITAMLHCIILSTLGKPEYKLQNEMTKGVPDDNEGK